MSCKNLFRYSRIAVMFFTAILFSTTTWAADMADFVGKSGILRISGGTAHIPVMKAAAERIMTANPDIQITIAGGGSGVGIQQVGEGLVDIGNTGRKPTDEEIAKYDLQLFKWAMDGVAAVVNRSNKVSSLTKSQIKDIYAGRITSWKALGGADTPISVYTRDNASGTREVFWKKALDEGEITPKANFAASNGAMKSAVANDPNAIGYVSVGHIDESVTPVILDGVMPNMENVKNGAYPIARGLFSNTKGVPGGLAKAFIDFLYSADGEKIIAENGFIPVRP